MRHRPWARPLPLRYLIVGSVAALVAILTFFSGFGLGTLLLPAFSFFFPVEVAVAATALVHLANNLFKLTLVGRSADRRVFLRFAVPAAAGAILGANLLALASERPPSLSISSAPTAARSRRCGS